MVACTIIIHCTWTAHINLRQMYNEYSSFRWWRQRGKLEAPKGEIHMHMHITGSSEHNI